MFKATLENVAYDMEHTMCRSIKTLRNAEIPATDEEIHAAALQFVRKVSGYRKPSRVNEAAFERAVDEVAEATHKLLHELSLHVHRVPN